MHQDFEKLQQMQSLSPWISTGKTIDYSAMQHHWQVKSPWNLLGQNKLCPFHVAFDFVSEPSFCIRNDVMSMKWAFFNETYAFWVRNQAFLDVSLGIWIIWVQIRYSFEIRYSSIKKRQRAHLLVQGWGRQSTQVYFFSGIILIAMSIVYSGEYNSFAKFHTHENGNSLWVPA